MTTQDRILDAAERCFATNGVAGTSIVDVARTAGVSRPTVYRWFTDLDALHAAFLERAARRVGADVAAAVDGLDDPEQRIVAAVLATLRGVRADPTLSASFGEDTPSVTRSSPLLIRSLATALPVDDLDAAAWVVRVTVSLLSVPGGDEAHERALLEQFVAPVVVRPAPAAAAAGPAPAVATPRGHRAGPA